MVAARKCPWNVPDQWLAARGLSIKRDAAASRSHPVVRRILNDNVCVSVINGERFIRVRIVDDGQAIAALEPQIQSRRRCDRISLKFPSEKEMDLKGLPIAVLHGLIDHCT